MSRIIKFIYFILFISILLAVIAVSNLYTRNLIKAKQNEYFTQSTTDLNIQISRLISEKRENQLSMLQQLTTDKKVLKLVKTKKFDADSFDYLLAKLHLYGDSNGSWLQIIDKEGVSIARSWNSNEGDNLTFIRSDVVSMIKFPKAISSISVGKYDMSFKTMLPIYDDKNRFVGFIELISNFDSIAQKLKDMGYKPLVLVNKAYKNQLIYPMTKKFVDDYYVSNKNADEYILEELRSKGVTYFISPDHGYVIDKNIAYFNYALFDQKELFLGNILLAKDISSFNMTELDQIKNSANILTIVLIILLIISFYVLSKDYTAVWKIDSVFYFSLALFLFFYALYFLAVHFYFQEQEDSSVHSYNEAVKVDFEKISDRYSNIAKMIFKLDIENIKVFETLKKAQSSAQKDQAAEELYNLLRDKYETYKTYGVRQLHFYFSNNESFLKMDNPQTHEDDFANIRLTAGWANQYHQRVDGFEEGQIFNGFRHLFPLFYQYNPSNKLYLGSVEISFDTFSLLQDLIRSNRCKGSFLIKSDLIKSRKINYEDSMYKGWSFDKAVTKRLKNLFIDADISLIYSKNYNFINKSIQKGEIFSIDDASEDYLFTFIPLQNPLTKQIVAVFILQKDKAIFLNLDNSKQISYLVGFILLLFIFMYMYKEISIKKEYKLLLRKTQRILDAQDSIVVITGKDGVLDVNKKFLDFFGFISLYAFKLHYRCISDKFINDSRLFHLEDFENKRAWIAELAKRESRDKIVSMMDKNAEVHYFMIQESRIDENYLLELSDISDTVREKFKFISKAYTDTLTGAYNREYFNANIEKIINSQMNNSQLGIMFCDIDFFKNVNDTYGHDIGDQVLKQIVELMKKMIRSNDIVIRWGGEEFVILLYVDSVNILVKIANNLRIAIEEELFDPVGRLTCSFGLSGYQKGEDILKSIKRADEALYEAKKSGRNKVKFKF